MGDQGQTPPLLVERASAFLGLDRIAVAAGHPNAGPYLVPLAGFVLDVGILSGLSYLLIGRDQYASPYLLTIPVGLLLGIALSRWLRDGYVQAVDNLPGDDLAPGRFLTLPSNALRVGSFVLLYLGNVGLLVASPAEFRALVEYHGPYVAAANYLLADAFYLVVFADVLALLIASMVVLPWHLYNNALTLDFSDPFGFAGLYEVSRLLRTGTVVYFVGMIAWSVWLVTPPDLTDQTDVGLFASLWVLGVLVYLVPVLLLHRHMVREKRRHILEIDEEIRTFDPDGERRGIPYLTPNAEDLPELQQKFIELQQVRMAREYPTSTTFAEELLVTSLLPVAIRLSLASLVPT